ncbi:thiamine-precursor transport protein ThiW [Gottschalkia purinilytica]|uniref:Thiamine-precursor transport protein ThiW n=1 Tax=Gottschalkia purinilytica TaxID=1503 RepID=A0A0L0WFC9_GOTPU|nr:energy coupling factor transporter S component ThiW [Gottschalkia purinilytica]KNF10192.1 thiamine-precursor transport protein ThiW [Gottschalkia purinilytica]
MKTKNLVFSALLIALGVLGSHIIYIPLGPSKCFPVQHVINILSAILLSPIYSVSNAFIISLLRNVLGTGSLLAFPGSMIGALLASLLFKRTKSITVALIGEVIGTGVIGALVSYPVAKIIMGQDISPLFFIIPFTISTLGGSIIAYVVLSLLKKISIFNI